MDAALFDVGNIFEIFGHRHGAEHLTLDDVGKTDNGVQRGAQFVAHIGQEQGFAVIRGFGGLRPGGHHFLYQFPH